MSRLIVTISPPTVDADRVVLGALGVADKPALERAKVTIQNQSLSQVSSITLEGLTNAQAKTFQLALSSVGGRFSVTTHAEYDPEKPVAPVTKPPPESVSVPPKPATFVPAKPVKPAKSPAPDYLAMSKAELQALCERRKVAKYGTKDVLIARLEADDRA